MLEALLNAIPWVAKIIAEWPQRRKEAARNSWVNWRAGVELRKEIRRRRAALVESNKAILRNDEDKLP